MISAPQANRYSYAGNGVTTAFAYSSIFQNTADLLVLSVLNGGSTILVLGTDYTVTGGSGASGTVTTTVAVPSGTTLVIIGAPAIKQGTHLVQGGPAPAAAQETAYDYLTELVQRLNDQILRCLLLPDWDTSGVSLTLPSPLAAGDMFCVNAAGTGLGGFPSSADRASKFLAFDASGNPVASASTLTGVTATAFGVTLVQAASAIAARLILSGYTTTATAAGTTVLTSASTLIQYFTGVTTQSVSLPVVSTLALGNQFVINNLSTGLVTVQSSGGNSLQAMAANTQLVATCIAITGTGTAAWSWTYLPSASGKLPEVQGGTNQTGYTTGDTLYASALNTLSKLAIGSTDQVMSVSSGIPSWSTPAKQNFFLNGAVDFDQELALGAKATAANGQYIADNFKYSKGATVVHTVQTVTDAPTQAQAGFQLQNSVKMSVTTANASPANGDFANIASYIEGYVYQQLKTKVVTLSFWVKSHRTGTYCVSFRNNGGGTPDRSYVVEYTVSVADTWEQKSVTLTLNPSGGTDNYTTGIGLYIAWTQQAGSTFQTTANAWQTGNFFATSNQVNATAATSDTLQISGVQLNLGSAAGAFERFGRTLQGELAACQRNYSKTFPLATAVAQNSGATGPLVGAGQVANITFAVQWAYPVTMRTSPTLTTYSPSAASANWTTNTTTPTAQVAVARENVCTILGTTSVTAGNTYQIHATADARF